MNNYVLAHVRLEGHVNQIWYMVKPDGTQDEFYAYESSPCDGRDDSYVWETDPALSDLLLRLLDLVESDEDDEVEFTVDLITGKVTVTLNHNVCRYRHMKLD